MDDLPPLDRLMEKLKTIESSFSSGVAFLAVGAVSVAAFGMAMPTVFHLVAGVAFVAAGVLRGGPFRAPLPASPESRRVPSERRVLRPSDRMAAGAMGAFGVIIALWAAYDGDWFGMAVGFVVGLALLLIAATGGGRVWIDAGPIQQPGAGGESSAAADHA